MSHPRSLPALVVADKNGEIFDFPPLTMAGRSNGNFFQPALEDLIPLPEGSELFTLPGRLPIGCDSETGEPLLIESNPYDEEEPIQAVAAFMAPAHTSILNSAFQTSGEDTPPLPLFAYTAVGWYEGQFWVAGFRSDNSNRQDVNQFNQKKIDNKTRKILEQNKDNRLIQHLGKCCLTYGCPAARNYFLGRWEAPLPTSPTCNARCVGCISLQPSGCCPSTQDRIQFVPTAKEICELAVPHLQHADKAIVSFGQGCEGEPLLQTDTIKQAIIKMRKITDKGTINLNSNASLPDSVKALADVGLDSIRVSLNSAQEKLYNAYYRPVNYHFDDVKRSIDMMKQIDRFVSLNYFIQPGVTDSEEEYKAFSNLLHTHNPDFIQLRNLNMDPDWYFNTLSYNEKIEGIGVRSWFEQVKSDFPEMRFGYFNPSLKS
jgi:wyosine [tRNA(Phe)-imidazoG37] synthetase (radical SAM superfamily)